MGNLIGNRYCVYRRFGSRPIVAVKVSQLTRFGALPIALYSFPWCVHGFLACVFRIKIA